VAARRQAEDDALFSAEPWAARRAPLHADYGVNIVLGAGGRAGELERTRRLSTRA